MSQLFISYLVSRKGRAPKQDIAERFSEMAQARRYRDRFFKKRKRTHEREIRAMRELLTNLSDCHCFMDVASGQGRFTPLFTEFGDCLIQVDFSKHMLALSREDYPLKEGMHGGYIQADARHLPFDDQVVDAVFCHRLLNHLPDAQDRRAVVNELARTTKKYVIVSCLPAVSPFRVLKRLYSRWIRGRKPREEVDPNDLLRDAQDAGLRLIARTPIRSGFHSSAFLTFARN